ncbi:MAG TPA: serine hydrolase domain-containing protein [Hyphomicrobiaceae bacterium]|nr:serine hydrolase domain-containing protein [Hyphomicrobiaceae bacterium]
MTLAFSATAPQTQAINQALREGIDRNDAAGVVAMAADRMGVIYRGAFGVADLEDGRPLEIDSLFRIASMTKAITSVAAMQLVEQGRLGLDDAAEKFLPQLAKLKLFQSFDAATGAYELRPVTKTMTMRHLFTHTSGFGYPFTSPTIRDFKPRAGEAYPAGPLMFEPGEQWLYSTSTDWLGRVVETVSGQPLEDYFRAHIFAPLGMADTAYHVPDEKLPRLVTVNRRLADGSLAREAVQAPVANFTPMGGGGLSSTAGDYIRFTRMLLNFGVLEGARVLSARSVEVMAENHIGGIGLPALKSALPERSEDFSFIADGRDKWGLGFQITTDAVPGKRSAGSLSWGGINNTYFWIDHAQGITGVILMQFLPFADRKALALYDAFERAVYQTAAAKR